MYVWNKELICKWLDSKYTAFGLPVVSNAEIHPDFKFLKYYIIEKYSIIDLKSKKIVVERFVLYLILKN